MPATYKETSASTIGVAPDAYIYTTLSIDSPQGFLAIASDDSLCSYETNDGTIKPIISKKNHHKGITCIATYKLRGSSAKAYVTAGRDGRVRAFTWPNHTPLWEITVPESKPISALATIDAEPYPFVAAGTEHEGEGLGEVGIYVWALPPSSSPILLRTFTESHTDTITALEFATVPEPRQIIVTATTAADADRQVPLDGKGARAVIGTSVARLLSASTDGLVNYYTLEPELEDDSVLVTFNNRAAVHHACLVNNKTDDGIIAVISHDEQLSFYSVSETEHLLEGETKPGPWDLRQLLACDYAISLRAGIAGSTVVVEVGANKPETADRPWAGAFTCKVGPELLKAPPEPQLDGQLWMRLEGAHGEEVVRGICYDRLQEGGAPMTVTCGEDGHVRLWRSPDQVPSPAVQKDKKRTGKPGKKDKSRRFEPY